jgi:putative redox protein
MRTPPAPEIVSLDLQSLEGSGLRFTGHSGSLTVPFDSGRDAQAVNPVQMLLLSLGACTAMDVIAILRKQRQAVTGYEVAMRGERRAEHPRSFHTIEVVHRLRGHDLSAAAAEEAVRLSTTKYCSVSAQIAPTAAISHRVEILAA